MKKAVNSRIKTADFARMCGTNKRTLIYYDEIDLFSPTERDENGYRYYSEAQYDVFLVISALKEIGMPLEQIKNYLDHRNSELLNKLLIAQEEKINAEIIELLRIQEMIQTKKKLLKIGGEVVSNMVLFETIPEEYLVLSDLADSSDHKVVMPILYNHLSTCHREQLNVGHPFGAIISGDSLLNGEFDRYAYFFTKISKPLQSEKLFRKPAGIYATIYLKGDYYETETTYDKLLTAILQEGYAICGFSYKEGIIDEIAEKSVDAYITKISVLVEKDV